MKRFPCALLLWALLALPPCGWADQEMAPYPHVTSSEYGRHYFRLVPGEGRDDSKGAVGTCYRVERTGNDTVLWTTRDWYAFKVYLSTDGQYLVRLGNWPRGHTPSADHLAVAFYRNGELLKSYSTLDLITFVSAVRPSVSHYFFYTGTPVMRGNTFTLTTVDDITHTFNIATGEIIRPPSPAAPEYLSSWVTVNDIQARLCVSVDASARIIVIAELKNSTERPVDIVDLPRIHATFMQGGALVPPEPKVHFTFRANAPFTVPAGATIVKPLWRSAPPAGVTYSFNPDGTMYALAPGEYTLIARLTARLNGVEAPLEWTLPAFQIVLPPLPPQAGAAGHAAMPAPAPSLHDPNGGAA